jgi:hypothetical protein
MLSEHRQIEQAVSCMVEISKTCGNCSTLGPGATYTCVLAKSLAGCEVGLAVPLFCKFTSVQGLTKYDICAGDPVTHNSRPRTAS